jgi:ABC-2 type transport system ATP-binding protein
MIAVSRISKRYGARSVVDDVSFTVTSGRVTGFVGPNGAGKSTTMRMMVGLARPSRGEIRYHGVRYSDLREPARVVGSVLDARCMHPGRTARQHLRAMAALGRIPAGRVEEALAEVGLESAADRPAGEFSLGMRQRLALAGALLGDPEALLLDEPSNGLDPEGIRWLRDYLTSYSRRGGAVFVSSHLIAELEMFADDLVVVGGGKLIAAVPVAELTGQGAPVVVAQVQEPETLRRLLTGQGYSVELNGGQLEIRGASRDAVAQIAFDHRIRVLELAEKSRSLEDTLIEMTGAPARFGHA